MGRKKTDKSADYQVGFGRPPKHTRFKPGQSGNPKGRPKAQPTVAGDVAAVLKRKVAMKQNGRIVEVSMQQAILTSLAAKAAQGDTRATALLLNIAATYSDRPDETLNPADLALEDRKILDAYFKQNDGSRSGEEVQ